jgi:hypothetical protein
MFKVSRAFGSTKPNEVDMDGLVFVAVTVLGVQLFSAEPVTMTQCAAIKELAPQTLCVDKEPDCGKGTGNQCLGRADQPAASPPRRKHTVHRHYHRSSWVEQQAMR